MVLFYMLPVHTWAQFNQVSIYPPEAASLMRNVDYPVGHLNGMPNIKIPIDTIKAGSLTLPLEISFHIDSYIRANQMPGSVGAGWSLSSELQVSRTINGKDDLGPGGYCSTSTVPSNFTNNFPYQQRTRQQMKFMVDGSADEEPDKFFYQLLGKSGAFYFQKQTDGSFKPIPVPFNGIKINYNNGQFTIIDTDGTSYGFSTTKNDWSNDVLGINRILAWKCEGIKNAAGIQEITFNYSNSYNYLAVSYSDRLEVYDNINYYGSPDDALAPKSNLNGWGSATILPFWQITGPKLIKYGGLSPTLNTYAYNRLGEFQNIGYYEGVKGNPSATHNNLTNYLTSEITFRGGRIVFLYTNECQLSSIQIKNDNGTTIKTVSFTQSYDGGNPGNYEYNVNKYKHSRKLDMLHIDNQKYSFTYGFDRQYGSVSDFWGYEAIMPDNYCVVPHQQINVSMGNCIYLYDGYRVPQDPYFPFPTMIGNGSDINHILSLAGWQRPAISITYPTGGKTEFIVGPNRFRDPVDSTIKGAGGYRIEKIKYYDGLSDNPVKEKIYKYGPNEDETGMIRAIPSFSQDSSNCYLDETNTYVFEDAEINSTRKRTYLSGSSNSLTFSNGAPVNYNEVTEYDSDMGEITGKTVYKYDLYYYFPEFSSPTNPFPLERNDWDIGMPDSVIHYKYQNGQLKWVKRKNMDYNKFTDPYQIFCGRASLRGNHILVGGIVSGVQNQDWYTEHLGNLEYKFNGIKTGAMQLVSEDESQRGDDGNIITTRTNYSYNNPDPSVVSRIENTGSDGLTTIQNIIYPLDYASGGFTDNLIIKNIVSAPVERITRRNGKIVSGQISIYNNNGTVASTYQIESNQLNQSGFKLSNRAVTGDYSTTSANVAFNRDPAYIQKLALGWDNTYLNLQQNSPSDNISTSYIWGYNNTYPVVKADNIDNSTLSTKVTSALNAAGITNFGDITEPALNADQKSKWLVFNSVLRNSLPANVMVTTLTFKPLVGMTSQTDSKGMITYYEYDSFQRLKSIKDQNGNIIKSLDYHYKQ